MPCGIADHFIAADEAPPAELGMEVRLDPLVRIRRAAQQRQRQDRGDRGNGRGVFEAARVEESDQLEAQAAEETARILTEALSELRVGLVLGAVVGWLSRRG